VSELNAEIHGQSYSHDRFGRSMDRAAAARGVEGELSHIALHIVEGTNSVIEPQLVKGQLDLAVVAADLRPELTGVDIFSEDLVLIVAKDHPLASTPSR